MIFSLIISLILGFWVWSSCVGNINDCNTTVKGLVILNKSIEVDDDSASPTPPPLLISKHHFIIPLSALIDKNNVAINELWKCHQVTSQDQTQFDSVSVRLLENFQAECIFNIV